MVWHHASWEKHSKRLDRAHCSDIPTLTPESFLCCIWIISTTTVTCALPPSACTAVVPPCSPRTTSRWSPHLRCEHLLCLCEAVFAFGMLDTRNIAVTRPSGTCGGSEFLWSLSVVAIERGTRKSLNEDESYNFPAIYIHNEFVLY